MFDVLNGVKVLDLSQYLPGPFATRMLADLGADVLKVEPPAGDPLRHIDPEGKPGTSPFYELLNAGKTVTFVDLKAPDGAALFTDLVASADVLLESYRPGVLERLNFGEQRLKEINPKLIHCALSGFGQTGPARLLAGHDLGYEAMTGNLSACGLPDHPAIPYPPMADHAGAMQAVVGILAALIRRGTTGCGAYLDISLMESLLQWQAPDLSIPQPLGGGVINGGAAFYQIYRTADHRYVSLSPIEPKFWTRFCRAVDRPDWIERQFEPLPQNALIAELAAMFAAKPLSHWEALLAPIDCCYQAVLTAHEVLMHPHILARGLVHREPRYVEVRLPVIVDGRVAPPRLPLAEDTAAAVLDRWRSA
jgi:crotonobetainyl-CoA:carnitine CoA-transferase CaiB-like acyl-CoA transferase